MKDADAAGRCDNDAVGRTDRIVTEQFIWEVGETLELIRSVTMAGSHIHDMTVDEILSACLANLVEMGNVFEFSDFVASVQELGEVVRFDRADGSLIDKHIDEVAAQSRRVATT